MILDTGNQNQSYDRGKCNCLPELLLKLSEIYHRGENSHGLTELALLVDTRISIALKCICLGLLFLRSYLGLVSG